MLEVKPIKRESIDAWPLAEAGLPVRVVNSVLTIGISKIGELRAQSDQDILALRSLGRISLGHIRSFFKICNQIEQGKQSFHNLREIFSLFLDESQIKVIMARYGFEVDKPVLSRSYVTLKEIGDAEHKTRERIRQVQETAMRKLGSRLATVCLEPLYFFFSEFILARGAVATSADLSALKKDSPVGRHNALGVLMLLSDLHPERITYYHDFFSTLSKQAILTIESQAVKMLDEAAKALPLEDILKSFDPASFLQNAEKQKHLLTCILDHCPAIAATIDKRYFTYARGTPAFLAEVMKDLKRPVHYRTVTHAFNERLKSLSRKGAGFILDALNAAPLCTRVDRGIYDLKAG